MIRNIFCGNQQRFLKIAAMDIKLQSATVTKNITRSKRQQFYNRN